jgi:hypothetical protein
MLPPATGQNERCIKGGRREIPIPKFLARFSMRGFFAFLGALFCDENGAGATFFLGAYASQSMCVEGLSMGRTIW